jgi:hypothetical protein
MHGENTVSMSKNILRERSYSRPHKSFAVEQGDSHRAPTQVVVDEKKGIKARKWLAEHRTNNV